MAAVLSLFLLLSPAFAETSVQFRSFIWKSDDSFELALKVVSETKYYHGDIKEGDQAELEDSGLKLSFKAHSSSFLSLVVTDSRDQMGKAFILERQNSQYKLLSPILTGVALTLRDDLNASLAALEKRNGWDHSIALRSMLDYFQKNPSSNMAQFRITTEAAGISILARPQRTIDIGEKVHALEGTKKASREEPAPQTQKRNRPRREEREVMPYEPRYPGYNQPRERRRRPSRNLFDYVWPY